MTAATLYPPALATAAPRPLAAARWPLLATAAVVAAVFFFTEHNLRLSLAEAYTQTAEEMELTALGGNTVRRVAFLGLALWGLALALTSRQPGKLNPWLALPLAGYLLVAGLSLVWSIDTGMCFRRLVVVACCAAAAFGIGRRFTMRELCLLTVAVIAPLVLTGLVAELALGSFRPWTGDYRFSGSVHPNTQGMYLTALALAALGLARSAPRPRGWWLLFVAALVLLVLTKSRTGNAATLLAIGAVLTLQTPWQTKLGAALALATAALAVLWLVMVLGYDPLHDFRDALLLGRAEESDTLSGRKFIWPLVLEFVSQRAWLGYGYESFWTPQHIEQVSDELQWGVREAHNGYLEVLLSTGLIGLALGLVATAAGLAAAASETIRRRDPAYALPLGMLVFGLASSWMESGMVGIMCPPFLTACCLMHMVLADDPASAAPPMEPPHART